MKLTTVPSDGAANTALMRLIAKRFGLRQSEVQLASGATSRLKRLKLSGDADAIAMQMVALGAEME